MTVAPLTLGSLRERYAAGASPVEIVEEVLARIAARGDDHVWITLLPPEALRAAAAALDPADRDRLPLWGVPYALKDNLDVRGLPTTAACPAFAYEPAESAEVVRRLEAAGALLIGKTNLDQFATGLNGTRSPYGVPVSVGDPALISGGSSSGSAVAVAAGIVPFSIGTDTAGSGRVPAALNGIVGLKPSVGLVSGRGMLPACRSLDCASVFAHDVADAAAVLAVIAGPDPDDAWSRSLPAPPAVPTPAPPSGLRLAVPARIERWGGRGEQAAWEQTLGRLAAAGVDLVPVGLEPFFEAGDQLYSGAWLAERLDGLEAFVEDFGHEVWPPVRAILAGAAAVRGVDTFAALDRMQEFRRRTHRLLDGVDALLTPTVTETFTVAEMQADPVVLNSRLGRFTTFTNLLDLCAIALPGVPARVPFGVTVQVVAGRDAEVAAIAATIEAVLAGRDVAASTGELTAQTSDSLEIAVVGAHLEGMPLHGDLIARGAVLVERTTTAPTYRFFALRGTTPPKPGLRRVRDGGAAIEVEVYRMPLAEVGGFMATVVAPLGIGQVLLADGRSVHGFICEPWALEEADDITATRGWRPYLAGIVAPSPGTS